MRSWEHSFQVLVLHSASNYHILLHLANQEKPSIRMDGNVRNIKALLFSILFPSKF